ncbi:hypothetical protein CFP56_015659 [Quercus suber]|uniref:Uncharacterized protein n=1 Tax=Quercus suber TaxID=58331 RepID=A0AAW0KQE0_QUESU
MARNRWVAGAFLGLVRADRKCLFDIASTIPISHYLSSPTSLLPFPFPFSILDDQPSPNHIKNKVNLKERFVLDHLYDPLPFPYTYSAPNPFKTHFD